MKRLFRKMITTWWKIILSGSVRKSDGGRCRSYQSYIIINILVRFPAIDRSGSRQNNIVIFIIRCQHPVRPPFVLDRLAHIASKLLLQCLIVTNGQPHTYIDMYVGILYISLVLCSKYIGHYKTRRQIIILCTVDIDRIGSGTAYIVYSMV